MGRAKDYEDQAHQKIVAALWRGEQVIQEVRVLSPLDDGPRARVYPALLAATNRRLIQAPIASSSGAVSHRWSQVHNLTIRQKWRNQSVSYLLEPDGFRYEWNIRKKIADPFLAALRERWAGAHRDVNPASIDQVVPPWYYRLFGGLHLSQIVVAVAAVAVMLWGWWTKVVQQPQDFTGFIVVFAAAIGVSTLFQLAGGHVHLPSGLRRRLRLRSGPGGNGSGILYWGPLLVVIVGMLVSTPAGTPTGDAGFASIYSVIALMAAVGVLSLFLSLLGSILILLLVMSLMGLFSVLFPNRRASRKTTDGATGNPG